MFINEKKMAIEMTKKFAAAARKFGTQQYRDLQEARRDYPNFKVVTVTRKATGNQDTYKGLTYKFMEDYPHQKELLFPDNKCDLIVAGKKQLFNLFWIICIL